MKFRHPLFLASLAGLCVLGAGFAIADPAGFPGVRKAQASAESESEPGSSLASEASVMGDLHLAMADAGMARGNAVRSAPQTAGEAPEADTELAETASGDNASTTPVPGQPADQAGSLASNQVGSADIPPPAFGFDTVINKARALAVTPYETTSPRLPQAVANLDYDAYRRIRPRPGTADWSNDGTQFQVGYAVQGFLFKDRVRINLVKDGVAREKTFDPAQFNFYDLPLSDQDKAAIGFAGLRITTPLNEAGKFDEFLSFQGASYFRALGADNHYGASARGLALSTASPTGEEFPVFKEFWLEQPGPGSNGVTVYALLDSRSVTGAYRFRARPGAATVIDVDSVLFPRVDLNHVGIAPLTSMFDFSPQDPVRNREDFRPRVHDSEGLMIRLRNGEWVWRPVTNPSQLEISSFTSEVPFGFGLMQRNREFDEYHDLEARYETRPSVWVEPRGEWGEGHLALVEIPTANEFNDNIVAYWRPHETWPAGSEQRFDYTMFWGNDAPTRPSVARVDDTRVGIPVNNQANRLFVIDFETGNDALLANAQAQVSTSNGTIQGVTLIRNPVTGGRRLSFELAPDGNGIAELRAVLHRNGSPVSETWLYRWRR